MLNECPAVILQVFPVIGRDIFISIFTAELFIFIFTELMERQQLAFCAACLFDHSGEIFRVIERIVESGNNGDPRQDILTL